MQSSGTLNCLQEKGQRQAEALKTLPCFSPPSHSDLLPTLEHPHYLGWNTLCLLGFTLHHIHCLANSFFKSKPSHYSWAAVTYTRHTHVPHSHPSLWSIDTYPQTSPHTPLPKQKPHSALCHSVLCIFPAGFQTNVSAAFAMPSSPHTLIHTHTHP